MYSTVSHNTNWNCFTLQTACVRFMGQFRQDPTFDGLSSLTSTMLSNLFYAIRPLKATEDDGQEVFA